MAAWRDLLISCFLAPWVQASRAPHPFPPTPPLRESSHFLLIQSPLPRATSAPLPLSIVPHVSSTVLSNDILVPETSLHLRGDGKPSRAPEREHNSADYPKAGPFVPAWRGFQVGENQISLLKMEISSKPYCWLQRHHLLPLVWGTARRVCPCQLA